MNIYSPPETDLTNRQPLKRVTLGKILAFVSLLMLINVYGGIKSLYYLFLTIDAIGNTDGIEWTIGGAVMMSIWQTVGGQIISVPGFIAALLVWWITDYRSSWYAGFCWFTIPFSLLCFPFATIFGLLLILAIVKNGGRATDKPE